MLIVSNIVAANNGHYEARLAFCFAKIGYNRDIYHAPLPSGFTITSQYKKIAT